MWRCCSDSGKAFFLISVMHHDTSQAQRCHGAFCAFTTVTKPWKKKTFKPVLVLPSSFVGRKEFMSLKIVAISIMNGNGKSSCELPFKVLRFVAFIYYHSALCSFFNWHSVLFSAFFFLSIFNFPHLILQCGDGARKRNQKKKTKKTKDKTNTRRWKWSVWEMSKDFAFHILAIV